MTGLFVYLIVVVAVATVIAIGVRVDTAANNRVPVPVKLVLFSISGMCPHIKEDSLRQALASMTSSVWQYFKLKGVAPYVDTGQWVERLMSVRTAAENYLLAVGDIGTRTKLLGEAVAMTTTLRAQAQDAIARHGSGEHSTQVPAVPQGSTEQASSAATEAKVPQRIVDGVAKVRALIGDDALDQEWRRDLQQACDETEAYFKGQYPENDVGGFVEHLESLHMALGALVDGHANPGRIPDSTSLDDLRALALESSLGYLSNILNAHKRVNETKLVEVVARARALIASGAVTDVGSRLDLEGPKGGV